MGEKPDLSEDRVFSLGWGLIYQPVCAPKYMTGEEVAAAVTRDNPPGTSGNEWVVTDEPDAEHHGPFAESNPFQCPDDPNRRHWLLNC